MRGSSLLHLNLWFKAANPRRKKMSFLETEIGVTTVMLSAAENGRVILFVRK